MGAETLRQCSSGWGKGRAGAVFLVGGATIERGLTPLSQSIPSARGGCPCLSVCDQTGSVQTTSTKQHGRRCSHTAVLIAVLAVRHPCSARQHRFAYSDTTRSEQAKRAELSACERAGRKPKGYRLVADTYSQQFQGYRVVQQQYKISLDDDHQLQRW